MQTVTTRHYIITCVIIVLLAAATLVFLDRFGKSSRVVGLAGTIQAQQIVKKMVDDPKEAYRIWRNAGYQGRTILYVADRWESFDPGELIPAQMFRAYPLQLYNTAKLLEDEHLSGVTLLYVASMNKIIRRIVAVMPETEVNRMKESARKTKDFKITDKVVFVSRQGFPRWYTTAANFTATGEPPLVYIGASYFKAAEPEELFRQLSASGLTTDCIILCNEAGKDSVTSQEVAKLVRFARLIGIFPTAAACTSKTGSPTGTRKHTVPAS
jgi:hypothetical protein